MLSALDKLFTSILNNRLYDYMVQKGILKAEQGGFRKMHETGRLITSHIKNAFWQVREI